MSQAVIGSTKMCEKDDCEYGPKYKHVQVRDLRPGDRTPWYLVYKEINLEDPRYLHIPFEARYAFIVIDENDGGMSIKWWNNPGIDVPVKIRES